MTGAAATVELLDAVVLVPADHPAPDAARAELDHTARTRLPHELERALAAALDPSDPAVWLIRELRVELDADLRADDDARARAWAAAIARAVAETLAAGPDGDRVVRFADGAAHLAAFVCDLAAGRAWDSWHYRRFESLRSLPPAAAAREALTREPGVAEPVLLALAADGRLDAVLRGFSATDARAVLDACARPAGGSPLELEAVLAAWPLVRPAAPAHDPAARLRLYLAARAGSGGRLAPAALRAAVDAVAALAAVLGAAERPEEVARALAAGDLAAVVATARAAPADALAALPLLLELADGDAGLAARAAAAVGGAPDPATATRPAAAGIATMFGGVFLLLPAAHELGLDEAALRLLVLARCLGPGAATDPAVMLAAGVERPPEPPAFDESSYRRLLLERLLRLGRAEGRSLTAETACGALIVRDAAHDAWVYAALLEGVEPLSELERALRLVHEACEQPAERLVLGAGLEALDAPGLAGEVVHGEPDRPAAADLGALGALGDRFDLACAILAHAVVRGFAARLLGFDRSGVEYLRRSFLLGPSVVRLDGDRIEVELPASPLHVVERMAGIDGQTYTVPWLPAAVTLLMGRE